MNLLIKPNNLLNQRKLEETIIITKRIFMIVVTALIVMVSIGSYFNPANASIISESYKDAGGKTYYTYTVTGHDKIDTKDLHAPTTGGAVLALASAAYGGMNSVESGILRINTNDDSPVWTTLSGVYGILSAMGCGLALFWCMLSLIDQASHGHITGEFFLTLAIKFTIAAIVIDEGATIANGMIGISNEIIDLICGEGAIKGLTATSSATDELFWGVYTNIKDANMFDCISTMLPLLLSAFMMKIGMIILYVLLAGRLIEVGIRYMFFPIGASDIFSSGIHSPGFRYMKKLAASALQGMVMYAAVIVGQTIMAVGSKDILGLEGKAAIVGVALDSIWPLIVLFSTIGAMLKVSSIANDVMGV